MPIQVKAKNGGTLTRCFKGETMNPNGRPKIPKTLKEFWAKIEEDTQDIIVKEKDVQKFEKDGEIYYRLNVPKLEALMAIIPKQMMNGNHKFYDIALKTGFAGGYEAQKTDITTNGKDLQPLQKTVHVEFKNFSGKKKDK